MDETLVTSPWMRKKKRGNAPFLPVGLDGHRQMWYALWRNRQLLKYLLKTKDEMAGCKLLSVSLGWTS